MGGRRVGLRGANSQRKLVALLAHLSFLREKLADLGVGGAIWVAQFHSVFASIRTVAEEGVYSLTRGTPLPISRHPLRGRLAGEVKRTRKLLPTSHLYTYLIK